MLAFGSPNGSNKGVVGILGVDKCATFKRPWGDKYIWTP
jgi:hypothetical protein